MIRPATRADLLRILEIRDGAGAERLSNPLALTDALACRLIEIGAIQVWQAPTEPIAGFVAIDSGMGVIAALLVAPGQQGKSIGRALLVAACDALRATGHAVATIALEHSSPAERHYRAAGWTTTRGNEEGELVFQKVL